MKSITYRLRIILAGLAVMLGVIIYFQTPHYSMCHLSEGRYGHEALLLKDGRILVSGGETFEAINPAYRNLQFLQSIPWVGRYIPTYNAPSNGSADHCEILDTKTWRWHVCRGEHGGLSMQLNDGRVFFQFIDYPGAPIHAQIFDPNRETWEAASKATGEEKSIHWRLVDQHRIEILPQRLIVNPDTNHYRDVSMMFEQWGVQLDERTVLLGGRYANYGCGKYDLPTGHFASTGSLCFTAMNAVATVLRDGRVLCCGGVNYNKQTPTAACELYDPKIGTWSIIASMKVARWDHEATALADGRLLVTGGENDNIHATCSCEIYDPSTGQWTLTGSLNQARCAHTATLLPGGQVLVIGGAVTPLTSTGSSANALDSCELYDPVTGTWTLL